jgi:hypothetical protein
MLIGVGPGLCELPRILCRRTSENLSSRRLVNRYP